VTIMTSNISRNSFTPYSFAIENGVEVYRQAVFYNFALYYVPITLPNLALLRRNYDIVHIHEPSSFGTSSLYLTKKRNIPLIVNVFNDPAPFYVSYGGKLNDILSLPVRAYSHTFFEYKLRHASRILALSKLQVEHSSFLRKYKNKVMVIGMGIDLSLFSPSSTEVDSDNILYVGRIDPRKGIEYLIQALYSLPELKLVVVGDGPKVEVDKIKRMSEPLGTRISLVGQVPYHHLADYYRNSILLCLPSVHPMETFGGVLLEALACGKPVITTNIVGFSEIIKREKVGFVVPPKDVASLSVAIASLVNDKARRREMRKRGIELAKRYSYDRITDKLEALYEELSS